MRLACWAFATTILVLRFRMTLHVFCVPCCRYTEAALKSKHWRVITVGVFEDQVSDLSTPESTHPHLLTQI